MKFTILISILLCIVTYSLVSSNDSISFPTGYVANDKDLTEYFYNYYSSQSKAEKEVIKYNVVKSYSNYYSKDEALNKFIKEIL